MVTPGCRLPRIMSNAPLPPPPNAEHSMVMPALKDRRWTAGEVRALPDVPGERHEVVDGELLVSPSPSWRHQRVVLRLAQALDAHAQSHGFGAALLGPGEFEFDPFTLVQPDVFVVALDGGRWGRRRCAFRWICCSMVSTERPAGRGFTA
jgi:hypothetical protein